MENAALSCLMRARDTLEVSSVSLALVSANLDEDHLFGVGVMCADLLHMIEELFVQFEILFPREISVLGPGPSTPDKSFNAELMLAEIADYFLDCREYLERIGREIDLEVQETEITDQDLWRFTAN